MTTESLSDSSQLRELSARLLVAKDIAPRHRHRTADDALSEGDALYLRPPDDKRAVAAEVLELLYDVYGTWRAPAPTPPGRRGGARADPAAVMRAGMDMKPGMLGGHFYPRDEAADLEAVVGMIEKAP